MQPSVDGIELVEDRSENHSEKVEQYYTAYEVQNEVRLGGKTWLDPQIQLSPVRRPDDHRKPADSLAAPVLAQILPGQKLYV